MGQSAAKLGRARTELARIEKLPVGSRGAALAKLATQLHADADGATDKAKAHTLAASVGELAKVTR
jgi:hypothetical protein